MQGIFRLRRSGFKGLSKKRKTEAQLRIKTRNHILVYMSEEFEDGVRVLRQGGSSKSESCLQL